MTLFNIKDHDIKNIMVSKILVTYYEVLTSASSAQVRWPIIPLFTTLKSDTNPSIYDLKMLNVHGITCNLGHL